MNRPETIQVITLLAGNYNSIAEKDKKQKELMINTWHECLKDLEYTVVLQAVKKTIIESKYPPTINEIRKNAIELVDTSTQITAIEAWDEAYKMICNSTYMTQEDFEAHSPGVKSFFGNVNQVRALGQANVETVNTVVKGQFLKQYEIIVEREKQQKLLPKEMKNLINKVEGSMKCLN